MLGFSSIPLWGLLVFLLTIPQSALCTSTTVSTIFQFPNIGSWIEGIAVRENGDILITRTDTPELWSINPLTKQASLLYTFPNATSTVGITELSPGIYAVGAGIVDLATTVATAGSFVIWTVDLRFLTPRASVLKAIPEGQSLSGMTLYEGGGPPLLLIADTKKGAVWRLDPRTGAYSVALSDSSMLPVEGLPPIGINGIKVSGRTLYYTSSTKQVFCRVALNTDGSAAGPIEVVASGFFQDGLALKPDGTAYITTHPRNTVLKVTPSGETSVFVGNLNSTAVAGSTDAQFGFYWGQEVLYVTTNGALSAPVNGTFTEPAKVVMVTMC
ncbi:uncharacterized protein N7482_000921 [Penicillium canariense]|uniref:SMP-30/Gluconolactonase/LRE-like region domain-containing protein n=1 Tax=Penicillium canariense TaxID=189055 RepID=A0A9W9ICI5_9EURO|nr:uncharacterized protein N7482_000921 [Penicillium canariense]KAJ5175044.1 hypothetical protein N7482_000921 [Penicillium canariense]